LLGPPASAGGADPVPGAPPPPPQAEARRRASARATGQDIARMPQTRGRIGRRPGQAPRAVGRRSSPRGGQKWTASAGPRRAALSQPRRHRVPTSISPSGAVDSEPLRIACQVCRRLPTTAAPEMGRTVVIALHGDRIRWVRQEDGHRRPESAYVCAVTRLLPRARMTRAFQPDHVPSDETQSVRNPVPRRGPVRPGLRRRTIRPSTWCR